MDCAPENVISAAGGSCALFGVLEVLLDERSGVLIPDPAWPVYEMATLSLGGEIQRYPLLPEAGWEPDLDALEAAITPNTRVVITNSPGNPTGGVHRRETVEGLVALGAEARPLAHLRRGLRGLRLRRRARHDGLARRRGRPRDRALHVLEDATR